MVDNTTTIVLLSLAKYLNGRFIYAAEKGRGSGMHFAGQLDGATFWIVLMIRAFLL